MDSRQLPYQVHLFTLRLWREAVKDGQVEWRGAVKNIETGEVRYFRDWPMLLYMLPDMAQGADAQKMGDIE
jgi:hypothetical protein